MISAYVQKILCQTLVRSDVKAFTINMSWEFIFEMDVCAVTSSDYLVEYEIKVSRQDFRADFKKAKGKLNKHAWLSGVQKGNKWQESKRPNRFYFVTPKGLVGSGEIPSHCGHLEVSSAGITVVKKAPLLHSNKVKPELILKVARNSCIKLVKFL